MQRGVLAPKAQGAFRADDGEIPGGFSPGSSSTCSSTSPPFRQMAHWHPRRGWSSWPAASTGLGIWDGPGTWHGPASWARETFRELCAQHRQGQAAAAGARIAGAGEGVNEQPRTRKGIRTRVVYAGVTRGISYGDFPREELRGGIGGPATESSSLFYFTPGGPLFKIGRARDTIYIYCYALVTRKFKNGKGE